MTCRPRFIILAAIIAVFAAGCGNKGPAEKSGEAVDKAAHDTGKAVEKAADKVEDAAK